MVTLPSSTITLLYRIFSLRCTLMYLQICVFSEITGQGIINLESEVAFLPREIHLPYTKISIVNLTLPTNGMISIDRMACLIP
jgi:hypothetical protein